MRVDREQAGLLKEWQLEREAENAQNKKRFTQPEIDLAVQVWLAKQRSCNA
jgi:hypothetical protein